MKRMYSRLVFLGAGASADAGIPTARQMTEQILASISKNFRTPKIQHVIRLAAASIVFNQGLRNEEPQQGINIEDVFNLLDTLANRNRLEASALIGAWHPVVEQLDKLVVFPRIKSGNYESNLNSQLRARDNARKLAEAISSLSQTNSFIGRQNLEETLLQIFSEQPSVRRSSRPPESSREIPGDGQIYEQAKQFLYGELKRMLWIDAECNTTYLEPLIKAAEAECIPIVTINYDNCVERTAKQLDVRLDTGIQAWREKGEIGFCEYEGVPFRKLHGSINWCQILDAPTNRIPLRRLTIREASEEEMARENYEPAVIFGGRNKLTAKGPFLDLLRDFRDRLNQSQELIVIGYSFNDDHINEYFSQWINAAEGRALKIINGRGFRDTANSFAKALLDLPGGRTEDLGLSAKEGIAKVFNQPFPEN